jgi:hypothetical protein
MPFPVQINGSPTTLTTNSTLCLMQIQIHALKKVNSKGSAHLKEAQIINQSNIVP